MKVLYLTNIPSPYRVDYFNELGKYCELTVAFERLGSSERDKSWENFHNNNFNVVFLGGKKIGVDSSISPKVWSCISKDYDRIFVTNFSDFTGMLALTKLKVQKIPYYLESDGGFAGSGKGIKEHIKHHLISGAQKYFSTGKMHDQYYIKYGAKKSQIVRYPFSSVHEKDIININDINFEWKYKKKFFLGIKEKKIILMVGQFIYRKGVDILLKAAESVSKDIGIYIIGGTPTDEYLHVVSEKKLTNVHFIEFMNKENLGNYYDAADLFVFPTREDIWGLVVNEALAHGLPVITTDRCLAGTELITHGKNGYIIPTNDANSLSKYINKFFSGDTDYLEFMRNSVKCAKQYTIEKMVEKHLEYFHDGVDV